jgi:uncharacterized membrane protein
MKGPPSAAEAARASDRRSDAALRSDHVIESLETLAQSHLAHHRSASRLQRGLDRVTALVGTPPALIALVVALVLWIGGTALSTHSGFLDPSFVCLGLVASCASLLVSVLILITQRHEDQLAERRGQLTLELAILADKKTAKLIALLEELRRDQPDVSDRHDPQSQEMAIPTDVQTVLEAIDERAAAVVAPP